MADQTFQDDQTSTDDTQICFDDTRSKCKPSLHSPLEATGNEKVTTHIYFPTGANARARSASPRVSKR